MIINEGFCSPKHETLNLVYMVFDHRYFIRVCPFEIYRFQLSLMANVRDLLSTYHVSGNTLDTLTGSSSYLMVTTAQQGRWCSSIRGCQSWVSKMTCNLPKLYRHLNWQTSLDLFGLKCLLFSVGILRGWEVIMWKFAEVLLKSNSWTAWGITGLNTLGRAGSGHTRSLPFMEVTWLSHLEALCLLSPFPKAFFLCFLTWLSLTLLQSLCLSVFPSSCAGTKSRPPLSL